MKVGILPNNIEIEGYTFRISKPLQISGKTKIVLLLHGHLGNENLMWIFSNQLPETYYIIAPRAPLKLADDQYSWHEILPQWPSIAFYENIGDQLFKRIELWQQDQNLDPSQLDVIGFSQGAVLAYSLALFHTNKVRKIAALSGFIPLSWQKELNNPDLHGKSIFIAHGIQDEIVPISKARQAAGWLQEHNAHVTLCETDTNHKVGTNCFESLGAFFSSSI